MDDDPKLPPVFLERASYRRRRLRDAARLWPVFGVILILFPLLWGQSGENARTTSGALAYIFGVWGVLICGALILARVLAKPEKEERDQ